MRADTLRLYKSVHTWTGIVAGMALFIAFYAGALTVFKEPIARWVSPPSPGVAAVSLADAPALIAGTLKARPSAAKDFTLYLQPAEHVPARLGWSEKPPGGDGDDHDESHAHHYTATLDQQQVRIDEDSPSALPAFIDTLHRVVGLPKDTDPNRRVMGVIAALYAVALVSGVILLLPTLVKDFFALRLGRNLKRMWLDAHNVVGIVSLPFHVVMALTAVVFAFHDDIYELQDKLIHQGQLQSFWRAGAGPAKPGAKPAPRDPATMLPPSQLLAQVQAMAPDFVPRVMQYAQVGSPRATVRVWGMDPNDIARSPRGGFVALDPYTGKVQNTDLLPGHQSALSATLTSFFTLHFATYGGKPVQWLYFLMGLGGAFLFYSGNLLWIESRRKAERRGKPAPVQSRSTTLMAAASVGVCLGCVSGISLSIVAGKWLHGHVADLGAWHQGVYYAVFLGSVAWAFVRGAARASVHLLWLAAACTVAIPVSSLLAWLWPQLGLWAHGSPAALGVDAVALAGALCWAWVARATARRVQAGRGDSVWSARRADQTDAAPGGGLSGRTA
ncbi:MAG TPA: PepSY domain-containing protein [Candidatus Aquabacterium excrementipullorum]|nr:PepSY domain-containing protein [Candidatus Aquabacterium excrementipullorum]